MHTTYSMRVRSVPLHMKHLLLVVVTTFGWSIFLTLPSAGWMWFGLLQMLAGWWCFRTAGGLSVVMLAMNVTCALAHLWLTLHVWWWVPTLASVLIGGDMLLRGSRKGGWNGLVRRQALSCGRSSSASRTF